MAHTQLVPTLPGILGPLALRPKLRKSLSEFTEQLMRRENSLTRAEQELIGTYVSAWNDFLFCMFNRYVDRLGTWAPQDKESYKQHAPQRAEQGYIRFN